MALHYSAHQFDQAYKPRVLRNWEIPKQFYDKPHKRHGKTEIISNDRGHLLPGVPKSDASPWGNYTGTWHLPKKIDRKIANALNGTDPKQIYKCKCVVKQKVKKKVKEDIEKQEIKEGEETKIDDTVADRQTQEEVKESMNEEVNQDEKDTNKENISDNKIAAPYVPGDLTDENYRPPSYEILAENRFNATKNEFRDSSKGYPKYREDFSKLPEIDTKTITHEDVEAMYQKHQEMKHAEYIPKDPQHTCKSKKKPSSPFLTALKNFQLAKKLHRENLEHDPLPDTISHPKYKKLQMERDGREPGLSLGVQNFATGVGWKGYPGYGPTRCTKLKVYRPKTGVDQKNQANGNNGRPSSVNSFDLKWRFIRQRKVTPIELAVCWDLTPENPKDEPKPPTHIDGSNGSLAPAVFSLVHTPKDEDESRNIDDNNGSIFERGPDRNPDDKEFILDRPKTSVHHHDKRRDSNQTQSDTVLYKKRAKSAYNLDRDITEEKCYRCAYEDLQNNNNNHRQSTPNLSESFESDHQRNKNKKDTCLACKLKKISIDNNNNKKNKKDDFKMAFKAGVPQNQRKDKRQDYPEHWRLATVYQHSYKPIHARKRPLLETVFK